MSQAADFIRDESLPDIEYRTNAPEEVVCPRVTQHEGVATVYLHNERRKAHQGFVPVTEFLQRLAQHEPGLAAAGYRANGRQTTISFNKADRVTLSSALQKYLALSQSQPKLDAEAQAFLDGFLEADNPQLVRWLPRYRETLQVVRAAVERDAPEAVFDLIWKSVDNAVSNAGRGILGFEAADRQRGPLVGMIREISAEGSPAQFDRLLARLEQWKHRGELPRYRACCWPVRSQRSILGDTTPPWMRPSKKKLFLGSRRIPALSRP